MARPIVSLFGPPGCGKSTQSKMLAAYKGWHHLSTGEALRALNDPWLNNHLAKGNFAPEFMVTHILSNKITSLEMFIFEGIVLDGYPRTFAQVLAMKELIRAYGKKRVHMCGIIHLFCSQEVAKQRTDQRTGRADDAAFDLRWRLYEGEVAALKRTCRAHKVHLAEVNAEDTVETIADGIRQALTQMLLA